MLANLHVAMPSRRDVKVSLHLIPLHAPVDPTRVRLPTHPRRLGELLPPLRRAEIVVHILILAPSKGLLGRTAQSLSLLLLPRAPLRGILLEDLPSEHTVTRGILHVDVQVVAVHLDHDVEVHLQRAADALLDAEAVVRRALEPAACLGDKKRDGGDDEKEHPSAAAAASGQVGGFGFCLEGGGQRWWFFVNMCSVDGETEAAVDCSEYAAIKTAKRTEDTEKAKLTKSIKGLHGDALGLPKVPFTESMVCEPIHRHPGSR